ncbi:aromatic ring-hydroxylating oxygenase subunit alpha [Segnochrobactrum spirostomi]|uniref:Rieske 2Fe-2S domain-containing protein n=1 Tax=Segnochrobactrum spirostomi TaxID=2608987 RepID=A0A6A7Y7M6_9HYPH|nr:Rieske 2Fe-2S domain-containing protein [Segnochrobactrum spirostomi]MQT15370.1 Rieske 2Fe-2S domain-containing protein [Segnochrobactrum spirostomi]
MGPSAVPETSHAGSPTWVAAAVSDDAFTLEQASLARFWTFVGYRSDIPNHGDWFTTTLGSASIFIQREKERIVAFENRCAHRFYPLRTSPRGNGPIVCGFHHWRYDADGRAIGVPKSNDMFGAKPADLCKSLNGLEVATCGDLIFARRPAPERGETLEDFLGDAYALVAALSMPRAKPIRIVQDVAAHWKFLHHISLDDYHLVAVHPSTFGKKGYLKPETVRYVRFGRHSAFFDSADDVCLRDVSAACAQGRFQPATYLIVNIFPNFLISLYRAPDVFGSTHWYASAIRYRAVARDRTLVESRLYPTTFETPQRGVSRTLRPVIDRIMPSIVAIVARRIMREDNAICAGLQSTAHQIDGDQMLGRFERRIGWFEEAYARALEGGPGASDNHDEGR